MSIAKYHAVLVALLLVAALWVATLAADRTPRSRPLDAAPTEFSGERAKALLQRLVGDDVPHPLGSAANARLRERIVGALQGLGLAPTLQSGVMVCSHYGVCGTPTNILARIEGTQSDERAVVLAAHYDSVAAGPGASDNGAGVACVLEIARVLQRLPRPRQSIILLLDDGEEQGLLGAQAFVQHPPWAATVSAAVNLDARGTSGPSLMFETGRSNRWLMSLYAAAIARPLTNSVYYAVYQRLPNDTDFSVFKAAGYQGFNFAFIGDVAHYHTPLDDWRHADAGSLQHQGDNALATLLALANAGSEPAPPGEAVYFDLFGRLLVRIPQAWMWPAALALLPLLLASGLRLLQLQLLNGRALVAGVVSLGAALAIGGIAATALMALLRSLGAVSPGGATAAVAHPWALQLSFAALAFGVTALAARLQRRAGAWGLAYAAALLYALVAVALARALAGASYLALLPALAALLALIPAMWPGAAARERAAWLTGVELAALVPCFVMFTLLLPIVVPLYAALGGDGLTLMCLLLIYGGFSLAALWASAGRRMQRFAIIASALCLTAGVIAALLLPRYTSESPQRLNLLYALDADTQRAAWIADPLSGALPAALRSAAPFAAGTPTWLPGSAPSWSTAAPLLPIPAPQLTLLSAARGAQQVHYRVHIASIRAAPMLTLAFSPAADVRALQLQGDAPLSAPPRRLGSGWSQLRLFGVPPQGLDVSFDGSASAFDLQLFDQTFGLPTNGAALQRARPRVAVPSQDGDVTIVTRRYRLTP
ncbi:MAG: M28 family peptidase [Steroidobacterales bacterium]